MTALRWAELWDAGDRNPDMLESYPTDGCPTCGAAFVEVDAVAVDVTLLRLERWLGPRTVEVSSFAPLEIKAARLVCAEGHVCEHHAGPPDWGTPTEMEAALSASASLATQVVRAAEREWRKSVEMNP